VQPRRHRLVHSVRIGPAAGGVGQSILGEVFATAASDKVDVLHGNLGGDRAPIWSEGSDRDARSACDVKNARQAGEPLRQGRPPWPPNALAGLTICSWRSEACDEAR
jgi:hypothetical protein